MMPIDEGVKDKVFVSYAADAMCKGYKKMKAKKGKKKG